MPSAPELTIVIPVLNERNNIAPMIEKLCAVLTEVNWEAIFVDDDSEDGTADVCRQFARTDARIRVLQRIGRRGLASACVEGMMASASPWMAVIDGDLQHDESLLPAMLQRARNERLDIVVATRNSPGGSMGQFAQWRVRLSNAGRRLSRLVVKTPVSDPMSGFFLISRPFLLEVAHDLSACGFKILVDILASTRRSVRIGEIPYQFRTRKFDQSKLDTGVGLEYVQLLLDKSIGSVVPVRFLLYLGVGAIGVVVHLTALAFFRVIAPQYWITVHLAMATAVAILVNFALNNAITFRSCRLKSTKAVLRGLFWYFLICSIGAVANVALTAALLRIGIAWLPAAAAGGVVTAVWNFAASSLLAWKVDRRRRNRRQRHIEVSAAAAGVRHAA